MKSKFLTSLLAAGVLLAGSTAFALTDAQKATINAAINGANTANLADVAKNQLLSICPDAERACVDHIINAAKTKLGTGATIASVRGLVNALVAAAPTKAPAIVASAGSSFPGMKANIASAAQSALATAASAGTITATQANALSTQVNQTAGVTGGVTGGSRASSLFQANQLAATQAARTEFQRSNQNNYSAP